MRAVVTVKYIKGLWADWGTREGTLTDTILDAIIIFYEHNKIFLCGIRLNYNLVQSKVFPMMRFGTVLYYRGPYSPFKVGPVESKVFAAILKRKWHAWPLLTSLLGYSTHHMVCKSNLKVLPLRTFEWLWCFLHKLVQYRDLFSPLW